MKSASEVAPIANPAPSEMMAPTIIAVLVVYIGVVAI
jgi:hypothetical protein